MHRRKRKILQILRYVGIVSYLGGGPLGGFVLRHALRTTFARTHGGTALQSRRPTMNDDNSSEVSAALELLQIKHHQPSRADCRATSELLRAIFQHTDADSLRHWLFSGSHGSGHRPSAAALLPGGDDDATHQSTNASHVLSGISELPMPIADAHDEWYLSPLHCYIRKTGLEYFAATDSNATTKGRQTMVSEGRVGVRCSFCKHLPRDQQAAQASEFTGVFIFAYFHACLVLISSFPSPFSFTRSSVFSQSNLVHLFFRSHAAMPSFPELP